MTAERGEEMTVMSVLKSGRVVYSRRYRPAWHAQLKELHAQGLNDSQIGRALGRNPGTVRAAREHSLYLEPNAPVGRPPKKPA